MQIHNIVLDSEDPEEIRNLVQKLIKEEYDIIACGHTIKKIAVPMGMRCFYEPDHRDVFFKEGFRTAISIAKANIEIKQKKKELETLIDYSFNSVMTLDESGCISISNNAASKMFRLSKQEIIGEHISNIIPQLNKTEIDGVLKNGKNIFGRIIDITHSVIVVNVNPVIHGTEIKGAVANFVTLRENDRIDSSPVPENKGGHSARYNFQDIIGESESISETKRLAFQFAKYDSNVLILGETGTGKELFAQSIHNNSLRNSGPFVAVNCGAIPLNLLESELFGYVEGAFTGALKKGKKGLIELADNGTIFLDEISEMDLHAQIRLLRVLEERSITRVGSNEVKPVNIRVIAASNKNLMQLIEKEKFREDLFYRLNVLTLYVPPLRKRDADPVLLTNHFLQKFGRAFKKSVQIEDQVKEVILSFDWTGNIRQLKNFCERLMVIADENIISADFVRQQLEDIYMMKIKPGLTDKAPPASPVSHVANHEKEQIISALNETGGNRIRAAEKLGISKATLWRKMTKHEISGKF